MTPAADADALEKVLAAIGFDPDASICWPIWDAFTAGGLPSALKAIASIGKEHTAMSTNNETRQLITAIDATPLTSSQRQNIERTYEHHGLPEAMRVLSSFKSTNSKAMGEAVETKQIAAPTPSITAALRELSRACSDVIADGVDDEPIVLDIQAVTRHILGMPAVMGLGKANATGSSHPRTKAASGPIPIADLLMSAARSQAIEKQTLDGLLKGLRGE